MVAQIGGLAHCDWQQTVDPHTLKSFLIQFVQLLFVLHISQNKFNIFRIFSQSEKHTYDAANMMTSWPAASTRRCLLPVNGTPAMFTHRWPVFFVFFYTSLCWYFDFHHFHKQEEHLWLAIITNANGWDLRTVSPGRNATLFISEKKLFSFISKIISIHTSMLSLTSSTLRRCTWWLSVESFYFRGRYLSTSCRWIFERGEVFAAELLLALRLFDQRALLLPMGESWEIFSGKKLKLEHIKCNIKLSFFVKSPIHSTDFNWPTRCGGKKRRTHWFDLNSQQSHHRTHFNNNIVEIITSMTTTNNWPSLSW